jgi:hypothetical protein
MVVYAVIATNPQTDEKRWRYLVSEPEMRLREGSSSLCDLLFDGLSAEIPDLKRKRLSESCSIYQEGRSVFAYIYHRKRSDTVEIWCRGDSDRLKACAGITFRERNQEGPVFGVFPGRFSVNPNQIDAAVRCLCDEAYPKS